MKCRAHAFILMQQFIPSALGSCTIPSGSVPCCEIQAPCLGPVSALCPRVHSQHQTSNKETLGSVNFYQKITPVQSSISNCLCLGRCNNCVCTLESKNQNPGFSSLATGSDLLPEPAPGSPLPVFDEKSRRAGLGNWQSGGWVLALKV